jgi:hypothetical protein
MNNRMVIRMMVTAFALLLVIAGCGSGGTTAAPAGSKIAVLALSTSGPAGTTIGSLAVTVVLPPGVTVKATPSVVNPAVLLTDSTVVVPSISGVVMPYAVYSAATSTMPGKIDISLADATGFGTGEFAKVTCNIADSSSPVASDFNLTDFVAYDLTGTVMAGPTAGFTATFSMVDDVSVTH